MMDFGEFLNCKNRTISITRHEVPPDVSNKQEYYIWGQATLLQECARRLKPELTNSSSMHELYDIKVTDRQSFIKFLDLLYKDYCNNQDEWQNKNLGDFLEAMTRYARDIQGMYDNNQNSIGRHINADIASWRVFTDILKGAIIYE